MPNKRTLLIVAGTLLFVAGTGSYLWSNSDTPEEDQATTSPFRADIVNKTVATGTIVPRNEVEIKSRVSGVVDTLHVEPGESVQQGDLIATIRIIPDDATLTSAEAEVNQTRIAYVNAKAEFTRAQTLFGKQAISSSELETSQMNAALAEQRNLAAGRALQVVRDGARRGSKAVNTEVRSTMTGMVLAVDVKEGASVIESNTFNEGTTIASVADMTDLVFLGFVDESEVGKIEEDMPLTMKVGAYEDLQLKGTLEHISPKGLEEEGAIQFEIRAEVKPTHDVFLRAGVSANADIVLEQRTQVLAVRESDLLFEQGKPLLEVQTSPDVFTRQSLETGISDGITIEVLSGIDEDTVFRQQGPSTGP
jgi:HlyD family secretion protein